MDGLSVKAGGVMMGGELGARSVGTSSQIKKPDISGGAGPKSDFVSTLNEAVNNVNTLQQDADIKVQKLATGQNTNLHETMIAVEKADIALKLMMQVRNKMIDAYHEVMKMQV